MFFNELSRANFIYTKPQFFFPLRDRLPGPVAQVKKVSNLVKHPEQRPKKKSLFSQGILRFRYSRPDPHVLLISLWPTVKQLRGFGQRTAGTCRLGPLRASKFEAFKATSVEYWGAPNNHDATGNTVAARDETNFNFILEFPRPKHDHRIQSHNRGAVQPHRCSTKFPNATQGA